MISDKICNRCGSSNLVSDRSLGGKIVCARCGSSSFKKKSFINRGNKKIFYFIIGFLVVLLLLII